MDIFNLEQLIRGGKFSTAHLTAPVLSEYFNAKIPCPGQIKSIRLSLPRQSFEDYFKEFTYEDGWRKN